MCNVIENQGLDKKHQDNQRLEYRRAKVVELIKILPLVKNMKTLFELISLLQEQPFFSSLTNNHNFMFDICPKITYKHCEEGDIIYKYKHPANSLFIILQGTVHLTKPEQVDLEGEKDQIKQEESEGMKHRSSKQRRSSVQLLSQFLQLQSNVDMKREDGTSVGDSSMWQITQQIIKIAEAGDSFGQMLFKHSLRATNAYAIEPCDLLVINRKDYDSLHQAQHQTQMRSKFLFLSSLSYFKLISSFNIERLCLLAKEKSYSYGYTLFKEGEHIEYVYIIKEGEFRLMKSLPKHTNDSIEKKLKNKSLYKNLMIPTKQIPFRRIGSGQILGDGQTLGLKSGYDEMCVCQSQCSVVFAIQKVQFFKILMSQTNYNDIQQMILDKNSIKKNLSTDFIRKRTNQSRMNNLLNINQSLNHSKPATSLGLSLNISFHQPDSKETITPERFFFNEINKTVLHVPKKNRLSLHPPRCRTQSSNSWTTSPVSLLFQKKTNPIPHCVRDIVSFVKNQANFQRRFRKQVKQKRFLFEFDVQNVPLYVKSKFNKLN